MESLQHFTQSSQTRPTEYRGPFTDSEHSTQTFLESPKHNNSDVQLRGSFLHSPSSDHSPGLSTPKPHASNPAFRQTALQSFFDDAPDDTVDDPASFRLGLGHTSPTSFYLDGSSRIERAQSPTFYSSTSPAPTTPVPHSSASSRLSCQDPVSGSDILSIPVPQRHAYFSTGNPASGSGPGADVSRGVSPTSDLRGSSQVSSPDPQDILQSILSYFEPGKPNSKISGDHPSTINFHPKQLTEAIFKKQRAALVGILLGHFPKVGDIRYAMSVLKDASRAILRFPSAAGPETSSCFRNRCRDLYMLVTEFVRGIEAHQTIDATGINMTAAALATILALAIGRLTLRGHGESDLIAAQFVGMEAMFMQQGLGPFNDKLKWNGVISQFWEVTARCDLSCGCFVCKYITENILYYIHDLHVGRAEDLERPPAQPFETWFDRSEGHLDKELGAFYTQLDIAPNLDILFHGWILGEEEAASGECERLPCESSACIFCSTSRSMQSRPAHPIAHPNYVFFNKNTDLRARADFSSPQPHFLARIPKEPDHGPRHPSPSGFDISELRYSSRYRWDVRREEQSAHHQCRPGACACEEFESLRISPGHSHRKSARSTSDQAVSMGKGNRNKRRQGPYRTKTRHRGESFKVVLSAIFELMGGSLPAGVL
ncbi:hypothetical protein N7468_008251 [Penicillium chermesinum]|uniref:Uncharacterized protein n=1 Tax=Penicillium chermesinum TaxID=63820 RepID=A0A9W9NPD8_9EURO|nr:uncharacterized protein N7468_008251 [Penicillium chermesinum]KAJ5223709.1 hypothetical protein N7468_008251 [Penicillium chermesinum]